MIYYDKNYPFAVDVDQDGNIERIFETRSLLGSIWRGRIEKKVGPFTFVTLGDTQVFLDEEVAPHEGESLLVQIIGDPREEEKAFRGTQRLSLTGRSMVVFDNRIRKVSGKLHGEDKMRLLSLADNEAMEGVLFRTEAGALSDDKLIDEYRSLRTTLQAFELERHRLPPIQQLYTPLFYQDWIGKPVYHNDSDLTTVLNSGGVYDAHFSYKTHELYSKLIALAASRVEMEQGFLKFERTSALHTIDVNTAAATLSHGKLNRTVNRQAAECIPREIERRNLSGVILIDFVGRSKDYQLLKILKRGFSDFNTRVYGFTELGLVEVARKNTGKTFFDLWRESQ
ncbi:ribonuclease E/G [Peptoniphilus equinus]|uniref:Ribonuclease E/G n=1 Tax=Peptoniphilus equinus TaxID=3016343 RepID=A0ABY7QXA2_9FIRM|nr:ribonuclease E/G [Peptoniphilus equinus]WBW50563.1 ribonuclease E/G [Peptoniphilus equinus]